MGKLEYIEGRIQELSVEELAALRERFAEFDAAAWDRQFDGDVKSRILDAMAKCALLFRLARRPTNL